MAKQQSTPRDVQTILRPLIITSRGVKEGLKLTVFEAGISLTQFSENPIIIVLGIFYCGIAVTDLVIKDANRLHTPKRDSL